MCSIPHDLAEINPYWFVVFTDPEGVGGNARWRDRALHWALCTFLRPGYRHCFAMRPMHSSDSWLVVNVHSACTDVLELSWEQGLNFLVEDVRTGATRVLCVRTKRPMSWVPRFVMSCATSVAHLIGVSSTPWMTPYKLYCQLKEEDLGMGGIFSSPKSDTSEMDAQVAEAKKEAEETKKKNEASLNAMRAGRTGRSLLAYEKTGEAGVKTTLGAG